MRTIEKEMIEAINARKDWRKSNTSVITTDDKTTSRVFLHGNLICTIHHPTRRRKFYTGGGWTTNTTKSRLNALGARIHQKNSIWYNEGGSYFKEGQEITL